MPQVAPTPLPRPEGAPSHAAPAPPRGPQRAEVPAADLEAAAKICAAFIAANAAVAEIAPPELWDNGCGAVGQARISAIKLINGKEVPLKPAALTRCDTAAVIAQWIREDVAPAFESFGGLARVEVAASYHCRPRNNIRGAQMSEHGRANALDVRALVAGNGRRFGVDIADTPILLLHELRRSSCVRFTTVLGPGSDGYHENHFHMDLAQRRGGYRLCRWEVPSPPDPQPRPAPE